jgi:uncharacterized membrane protein YcaP (DUF421 family)
MLSQPDWSQMFSPTLSLFELFLRGTLMYLFIFVLLRTVRRETGTVSVADVLVLVVIADAAQNGMAGPYESVTEGVVLVGTIVFWSVVIDWASLEFPAIGRLLHPNPIALVQDGAILQHNLRRNFITEEELMTAVRLAGTDNLGRVRSAWLEGNGQISVALRE